MNDSTDDHPNTQNQLVPIFNSLEFDRGRSIKEVGVIQAVRYIAFYFDNTRRIDSNNLRFFYSGFFGINNPKQDIASLSICKRADCFKRIDFR